MDTWEQLANNINDRLFGAHRGAFGCFGDGVVVFGNDGYENDPLTRVLVGMVKDWLTEHGYSLEGFAKSTEGSSWVAVAKLPPGCNRNAAIALANEAVWDCFAKAREANLEVPDSYVIAQRAIADDELARLDAFDLMVP